MLIDTAHQGAGTGRPAVRTLASRLSTREDGTAVRLSSAPENRTAAHLYASLGLRPTGVKEDEEVVAGGGGPRGEGSGGGSGFRPLPGRVLAYCSRSL